MGDLTPRTFVAKWAGSTRTERAASQEHFIDICNLVGAQTPNEADPHGDWYAFEKGAEKLDGGDGFADVWKRKHFAWEYKGKKKNLRLAYKQLLDYREALENPPLLVVSDLDRFEIHTNFTGTVKKVYEFSIGDIKQNPTEPLRILRSVLLDPDALRPEATREQLTEAAAGDFAKLADRLRDRGNDPHKVAHFLSRLIFCLFAEDAGLLPDGLLERLSEGTRLRPEAFAKGLSSLFGLMSVGGGMFGAEDVEWFNGGLFETDESLLLETVEIDLLRLVGQLDWAQIEPAIFGTLFERGLDPSKRSQLGAHYTDLDSINRVVQPVVIQPLRQEFDAMKARVAPLLAKRKRDVANKVLIEGRVQRATRARGANPGEKEFHEFLSRLRSVTVLDPACGSGNFLYTALRSLKDLEREVIEWGSLELGLAEFPRLGPDCVFGLELNDFAAELARVTIWIGHIQWMIMNGFNYEKDPILKPLDNIRTCDALFDINNNGTVRDAQWPAATFIIGNPPFLGGKFLRRELGDDYVDAMFEVFAGRVPREADLVTYWFEKARNQIADGNSRRAGLLATQGIRGGANREALERIKGSGDIFMAWPDEPWIVEGATVHVSIVGFDDGQEKKRHIRDLEVAVINANLTSGIDLTKARRLPENVGISFMGDTKGGPFDIDPALAQKMLDSSNPDGRSNRDVIRPWINAKDIAGRNRGMWIIDFPPETAVEEAAMYEAPFEYVKRHVRPAREESRTTIDEWWIHERPRIDMRAAFANLLRYIVTPRVSKHRFFVWQSVETLPDSATIVIARDDDYTYGVLNSRIHELWARGTGTQLREAESGFRYTPRTTFETFPFPSSEQKHVHKIGSIAAELSERRTHWLNPPDLGPGADHVRTLTELYNAPPTWLEHLHQQLDAAVATAYGWSTAVSDADLLASLLDLNLGRSSPNAPHPSLGI